MRLRDYQQEAVDVTLKEFEQTNSALAVMATGLGKTIYFAHLAKKFLQHRKIIAIVHRGRKFAKRKESPA